MGGQVLIRVNLLPYREERRRAELRRLVVFFIALLFAMNATSFVFFLRERGSFKANRVQLRMVEDSLRSLKKVKMSVERLERKAVDIKRRLFALSKVAEERVLSSYVLYSLAKAMPRGDIWLNYVVEDGRSMSIKGVCMDPYYLSVFMRNLKGVGPFVSVSLDFFRERKEGEKGYDFVLKVGMAR